MSGRGLVALLCVLAAGSLDRAAAGEIGKEETKRAARALIETYGASQKPRILRGVGQVAERWWPEDGDGDVFVGFCVDNFLADGDDIDATFDRLEFVMEQVYGHMHEVRRELTTPLDLDSGEVQAVDRMFGDLDLGAHVDEDLFKTKVAFLALLNFPIHTLAERLQEADGWDRRTWAASRMMDRFAQRVPAAVAQQMTTAFTRADQYIADYNIRMDRLIAPDASRPFPEGLRLITHWGLRDELKSQYAAADGLPRQELIYRVMQRIVRQEIPAVAIDNPDVLWAPDSGELFRYDTESGERGEALAAEREPDTRYEKLLDVFHAVRKVDPYSPTAPTYIDRRFNLEREIPEAQVEQLLVSVLRSREFRDTATLIAERLGRPLRPFDIWYDGFKSRGSIGEEKLNEMVAARYPDVAAFQDALPGILVGLGFSAEKAAWLSERIVVDPSRGAGHAMGAVRREDQAHLRTRFGAAGMDYKGYNIAVHELGHNVEQIFSLNGIDHWWLNGVPNTAFTEALAFVFQARDLELLGVEPVGDDAHLMEALDTLWGTAEIGGVALVDMAVWRFMYANPEATAAELREATLGIARDVWNRYFAPAFGVRDSEILAIYSHMIVYGLYLPDYPIGHIIAFQVADKLRDVDFGEQFERVCNQGRLTPDHWMVNAVGRPISSKALLTEARVALDSQAQ